MSKKKNTNEGGIIFSTDPDFKFTADDEPQRETLKPEQQKLKVRLDTKQRAGKAVTLVEGYSGMETDLEELGKKIKTYCGTGGSVKDGLIIIQGDQREKVVQWLIKNGFKNTRKM
jgi:translation initiation factor 1